MFLTSCAELDAGLVGHNSQIWWLIESRFSDGFPPNRVDGQKYTDLIQELHF